MKKTKKVAMLLYLSLLVSGTVLAQDFMIYPAQGQSYQQMDSDKYQCYGWAKNNSGFDPMQASAPAAAQQSQQGGLLRGGVRGAALGAVVGAIAGDAGKGAAIGAASGGLLGGMRRRDSQRQNNQANQQVQQNYNAARRNYDRAYSACLEGRGYTVK